VGGHCRRAIQSGLFDLKGGRVFPGTIAARSSSQTGLKRTCRPAWPRGHRYVPRPGHTEGLSAACCASYLRRSGERGRGNIPGSRVRVHSGALAQRCGQGAPAPVRRLRAAKRDEGGVARLSSETNDWGSIRQLKGKGAQMRKILTASVILALLFSLAASAQNARGTNRVEALPRDLEIQLALSALPPHLRDNATVYVLNPAKGFEVARSGMNGFHALVARTGDDTFRGTWPLKEYRDDILYPISFDEAGAKAQMRVFFDAAEMQAKGTPPEELKKIIQERYKAGYYKAPERAGVSYMLSPILRTYVNPEESDRVTTANIPHVMYYASDI